MSKRTVKERMTPDHYRAYGGPYDGLDLYFPKAYVQRDGDPPLNRAESQGPPPQLHTPDGNWYDLVNGRYEWRG